MISDTTVITFLTKFFQYLIQSQTYNSNSLGMVVFVSSFSIKIETFVW
jgi:hypothetical protein